MSDYVKEKVLRYPLDNDTIEELENRYNDLFYRYDTEGNFFQRSPTEEPFLDYVLEITDGNGEYGKIRNLSERECQKYIDIFKNLIPDIDMTKVRLVEFCWYDCSEAPDYYEFTDDEFYREV